MGNTENKTDSYSMDGEVVGVRVKSHNKKTKKGTLGIMVHVKMDDTQVFPFSRFGKVKLVWESKKGDKDNGR